MIQAQISGNKIYSNSNQAFSLYESSRFGEKKSSRIEYSPAEALYLQERRKLSAFTGKKLLSFQELLKKSKRIDKKIELKLPVFSKLRKKGYVVKTALKFGTDFRVYKKGVRPGEDHALWLCECVSESNALKWKDFAAKGRIANTTRKKLLLGMVDSEDDVTFYEVSWMKP